MPRHILSAAAYEATLTGLIKDSPSMVLATTLRSLSDSRVIIIADPLPAQNALKSPQGAFWQTLLATGDGERLASRFFAEVGRQAEALSVSFLEQPNETRADAMFSRDELRRGAVRMSEEGNDAFLDEDYGHLGTEYGHILLKEISSRL